MMDNILKSILKFIIKWFSDQRSCSNCKKVMKCEYPHYPLSYREYSCECGMKKVEDDTRP
jgi:hypothetical protein